MTWFFGPSDVRKKLGKKLFMSPTIIMRRVLMFRSGRMHRTCARSSASGTSSHMQSWANCITGTHESSFWKRQLPLLRLTMGQRSLNITQCDARHRSILSSLLAQANYRGHRTPTSLRPSQARKLQSHSLQSSRHPPYYPTVFCTNRLEIIALTRYHLAGEATVRLSVMCNDRTQSPQQCPRAQRQR